MWAPTHSLTDHPLTLVLSRKCRIDIYIYIYLFILYLHTAICCRCLFLAGGRTAVLERTASGLCLFVPAAASRRRLEAGRHDMQSLKQSSKGGWMWLGLERTLLLGACSRSPSRFACVSRSLARPGIKNRPPGHRQGALLGNASAVLREPKEITELVYVTL